MAAQSSISIYFVGIGNMNNSGLNNPSNFAPDFSKAIDLSSGTYTAPDDGWIVSCSNNYSGYIAINGVRVAMGSWQAGSWSGNLNCQIFVSKGDYITGMGGTKKFIPLK